MKSGKRFVFFTLTRFQGQMGFVMKPAQEKIENIDQRLRIQPLRGGNLLYIT